MRATTVLAFAFLATSAFADPAAVTTTPQPTGIPHLCLQFYPPMAVRMGHQGQTTLRYFIAADGTVQDIVVLRSSGNEDLDQAAVTCATPWTYKPATRDGKPVAVTWKANVDWYLHQNQEAPEKDETPPPGAQWTRPVNLPGESHNCGQSFNFLPGSAAPDDIAMPQGPTVVAYTIGEDGNTRDAVLTRASGSTRHDNAALACVKDWHYLPAKHDGKPVAAHWTVTIPWRDSEHQGGSSAPTTIRMTPPEAVQQHLCRDYVKGPFPAGFAGVTAVAFIITSKGAVAGVTLRTSSGNAMLDDAAVQCAGTWRYKPGTENDKPVSIGWRSDVNWAQK